MAEDRFEDAYQRWYPGVVRSAWAITRDTAVAEELAQEAFVKAYGRWRKLGSSGHAQPWIHRAAMNLALSWVRRHKRGNQLEHWVTSALHRDVEPLQASTSDRVVALLSRLPRRQREAVFLRVVADLPEREVAAVMGISPGSVKVHKKRGLDALRDLVGSNELSTESSETPVTGLAKGA